MSQLIAPVVIHLSTEDYALALFKCRHFNALGSVTLKMEREHGSYGHGPFLWLVPALHSNIRIDGYPATQSG